MGTTSYRSGSSKRIFTNYPFRKGMSFQSLISGEFMCKSIINYDYSNSGSHIQPRPAFVNALLHNGTNVVQLPEASIVMTTNNGPKFLISTDSWVSQEDFINDTVHLRDAITGTYGLKITKLENETTSYESLRGARQVFLTSVIDADTYLVKNTVGGESYPVRLLGVTTPDTSMEFATMALNYYLIGKTLHLVYDPVSEEKNGDDETLAYLFADGHLVNYIMLDQGLSYLDAITDNYLFYDELREAYYFAIANNYGIHGGENARASLLSQAAADLSIVEHSGYDLTAALDPTKELYFKQSVTELNNIDPLIYDTQSFSQEVLGNTDLFATGPDTYIQMLRNDYSKNEHNHTVEYFEYPHVNHAWRNALSFLGRIVNGGNVLYKGLITIQYNPTEDFRIIVIKPEKVNPLKWNLQDSTSLALNALDKSPQIYTDEIFTEEAAYFRYPTISTAIIYNQDPLFNGDAKIISKFDQATKCFIKPYLVVPEFPATDFYKTQIRFKYDPKQDAEEGWEDLIVPAGTGVTLSPYKKIFNSSGTLVYLKDTIRRMNGSYVYLATSSNTAWFNTTEQYVYPYSVLIDEEAIATYPIGTIFRYNPSGAPSVYYEVKNVLGVKDLSNLNARTLEVEIRTIYFKEEASVTSNASSVTVSVSTDLEEYKEVIDRTYNITFDQGVTVTRDGLDLDLKKYVDVSIERDGEVFTKRFLGTHLNTETSIYEFLTSDVLVTYYENVQFSITYKSSLSSATEVLKIQVKNNRENYTTIASTQIIYLTGYSLFNDDEVLNTHDVYNATSIAQLDRYVILYGAGVGNHSLQFLEFDNFAMAPFPYGQITFDQEIIHVHVHRGALYVFCTDGIWMLHKGFTYTDMIKTFAYAGISLHPAEKGTVASLGNNVFVVHNNKGFMIRTNVNVEDQSDIYTIPVTAAVDTIMEDPGVYLKERMQYGYNIIVHDDNHVKVFYKTFVENNELHLTASYFLQDPLEKIMITYIYNNDTSRWKLYDSPAATYPIAKVSSSNAKGFDYLCVNDITSGNPTIATYLFEIPVNTLYTYTLGDSIGLVKDSQGEWKVASPDNGVAHPFIPLSCEFDTGSLDLNSMHKKKVRRYYINLLNVEGGSLQFKAIPYVDGVPVADDVSVEAILNAIGDLEEFVDINTEIIIPEMFNFVSPSIDTISGYTIPESFFTTYNRIILDVRANLLGKTPGVKLLVPTTSRYHITHYAIVYRQQMAR